MKIVLENLLRFEDGVNITMKEVEAVANWNAKAEPDTEISFMPARVVLQDFTGVPCVVDLAAMRDAMVEARRQSRSDQPADPVGTGDRPLGAGRQVRHEWRARRQRRDRVRAQPGERYSFLRWGQKAFRNFKVVPPRTGIVHQVNLEHLARVVMTGKARRRMGLPRHRLRHRLAHHHDQWPRRARLGCRWHRGRSRDARPALVDADPAGGRLPADRQVAGRRDRDRPRADHHQMLRKLGVVGKFVEFFGAGLDHPRPRRPRHDRQHGARVRRDLRHLPDRRRGLNYLRLSGRSEDQIALVEAYAKAQGLWRDASAPEANYSDVLELDLATVRPSLAGPKRPQDRVLLGDSR
jgi:aconitate hydratase